MVSTIHAVVLAAGKGTRMNSDRPKVLHECFGEPMVGHVLRSLRRSGTDSETLVLGFGREQVNEILSGDYQSIIQEEQLGTGHAVLRALEESDFSSESSLLVTCGDIPGISPTTYSNFLESYRDSSADLMLLVTELEDPEGYGRVKVADDRTDVVEIVEEADASPDEKNINRINTGVMCGKKDVLEEYLPRLESNNEQGELYLTDVVELMNQDDRTVDYHSIDDTWQVTGINTRRQLVSFEQDGYRRRAENLLASGVTVHDPDRVKIGPWVDVEKDVVLEGDVTVQGECTLRDNVELRGNVRVWNSVLGSATSVVDSTIKSSRIGDNVTIGPYAHIRPGCQVGDDVRLGNFIEVKQSTVGSNSNISHLSYIGDAEIGNHVNVGAGTITCNYDGSEKYKTSVEDGVFIGSNVEIVAPVTIGEDATIGAGSTITDDVPTGSLGIGRERQKNIDDWD